MGFWQTVAQFVGNVLKNVAQSVIQAFINHVVRVISEAAVNAFDKLWQKLSEVFKSWRASWA